MLITPLTEALREAKSDLQALSCLLYLRDPEWPGEFRLLEMSGVRVTEPMFGFVYTESSRRLLGGPQDLFENYSDEATEVPFAADGIHPQHRFLFGTFRQREGVRAFAKVAKPLEGKGRQVILFVNYHVAKEFDEHLIARIRRVLDDLADLVSGLEKELMAADLEWRSEATKIVSPGRTLTNMDFESSGQPNIYFNQIIEAALSALNITAGCGLGVIHLYNAELQRLELSGLSGEVDHSAIENHSVNGQGIISWVALTKRALIVQNLDSSEFKYIHVSINERTKAELAVPLEVGGELIGTMCLECTEPNQFLPHHAYSVWYAANNAALGYQLYQLASINRKLLDLCWRATTKDAHVSLDDLATLAKDFLRASFCEISRYNDEFGTFDSGGASHKDFVPEVRQGGWTEFIRRQKHPVWINDIGSPETSVHIWAGDGWQESTQSQVVPNSINRTAIEGGVRSALGVPITIANDCIGVAWVKYKQRRVGCPKPAFMSLALGFAAQAGLVLDSIERREVDLIVRRQIDSVADVVARAIAGRWELKGCPIVDAYVISKPLQSKLGGDFYAGKVIDARTIGILILDGQGHGVGGSLHMLPLMTAFESICQSYSTAHVISHLAKTAEALGVCGSAVYGILTVINDIDTNDTKRWLSVTSAGPESLILFRRTARGLEFDHLPRNPAPMFGHPLKEPFMDHRMEVFRGDVVVVYSDGVAEQQIDFNQTHLATFVTNLLDEKNVDSNQQISPKEIAEAIMEESRRKQGGAFSDDVTVLVARVK